MSFDCERREHHSLRAVECKFPNFGSHALSHRRHVIRDLPSLPVRPRLNREQVVVSLVSFVPNLILASNASE